MEAALARITPAQVQRLEEAHAAGRLDRKIAARDVPMDYHLVVFSSDEIERAPINSQALVVGLGRGRRPTPSSLANCWRPSSWARHWDAG